MIHSALLTGELQERFLAQDSSHAVLGSALVLPEIGLAGICYDQIPINHAVARVGIDVNICSVDQPTVNKNSLSERKKNSTTQIHLYILQKNNNITFDWKWRFFSLHWCWTLPWCSKLNSLLGNGALYIRRLDSDIDPNYEPWLNCMSVWQFGQIP